MCAAPMVLTFAERMRAGATPAVAMRAAQTQLRQTKLRTMLDQMAAGQNTFTPESPEWGQVVAQRAWLCLRGGLYDDGGDGGGG